MHESASRPAPTDADRSSATSGSGSRAALDAAERARLVALRHDLHAHPELGFEETRTSGIVARELEAAGLDVHRGLAGTGVVGTLTVEDERAGAGSDDDGDRSGLGGSRRDRADRLRRDEDVDARGGARDGADHVGGRDVRTLCLRADMDALAMPETVDRPYRSTHPDRMHACGHDGHTTLLLGAARELARTRRFRGTVHFVFQPAEEGRGGARRMVEEGLFERFPCDRVYGLHNMPGLATDEMAVTAGPQLASSDSWTLRFEGVGTHGAKPHLGRDPITTAAHFLAALQTVPGRIVDPLQPSVVSACSLRAGDPAALNVIPDSADVGGTARAYTPAVRDALETEIGRLAHGIADAFGVRADYRYVRRIPPVVNDADATAAALAAAREVCAGGVRTDFPPSTAGDDFAFFADAAPGCYVWLGNGPAVDGALHHNGGYDFADDAIPTGVRFWTRLVERELAVR